MTWNDSKMNRPSFNLFLGVCNQLKNWSPFVPLRIDYCANFGGTLHNNSHLHISDDK